MKIIKNKWFPFGRYSSINICGILFTKTDNPSKITINHEEIHSKQIFELLVVLFYLWYGIEWFIRFIPLWGFKFYWNKSSKKGLKRLQYVLGEISHDAYRSISFEKEAYSNQSNLEYLNTRKPYIFIKYIKEFNKLTWENKHNIVVLKGWIRIWVLANTHLNSPLRIIIWG